MPLDLHFIRLRSAFSFRPCRVLTMIVEALFSLAMSQIVSESDRTGISSIFRP